MTTPLPPPPTVRRSHPLVCLKRLVIYKSIAPVDVIRTVPFTTGLNIIQGSSSNEADEQFESGHGVGKTTVCRLIRYCLGEKSFGQKHIVEEVRHCFPTGHVGAVVALDGTEWSVLRPLGGRGKDAAQEGGDLDGLIGAEGANQYGDFVERLADIVLSEVPLGEVLTSGQNLHWLHALAMCSRDQETRYDRFWNWRDKRSQSDSPSFKKPTVDAGLCVRALGGLLDADEPRLRTKLVELKAKLEETRGKIKEQRLMPSLRMTQLRESLVNECEVTDADTAPVSGEGFMTLPAITGRRLDDLRDNHSRLESEITKLDRQATFLAASLREEQELADQAASARSATVEGSETLATDLENREARKQQIEAMEYVLCKPGDVLFGQCGHVQEHLGRIDKDIERLRRSTSSEVARRDQQAARLTDQVERRGPSLTDRQRKLDELHRQRDALIEQRMRLGELLRRIPILLSHIRDVQATLEGTKEDTVLQSLQAEESRIQAEFQGASEALAHILAAQGERIQRLQTQFDGLVRTTLAADFTGTVRVERDGLHFRILRGNSLSGEAYETLAVLLADLTLLIDSGRGDSHHPGLLIHDSPREADLSLRIYQHLLDTAYAHMQGAGEQAGVPYQYIVTTTTPLSSSLQQRDITRLELSSGSGSLFVRQLEAVVSQNSQPQLFDQEEDA